MKLVKDLGITVTEKKNEGGLFVSLWSEFGRQCLQLGQTVKTFSENSGHHYCGIFCKIIRVVFAMVMPV